MSEPARGWRNVLPLTMVPIVLLVALGACSSGTPAEPAGHAPESLHGLIITMELEAIEIPDGGSSYFEPGERFNEAEYLPDGRGVRSRHRFPGEQWSEWITGYGRRYVYERPEPDVGKVDWYNYSNDGSTPAVTLTLTFEHEAGGRWEHLSHAQGIRSYGVFTIRESDFSD